MGCQGPSCHGWEYYLSWVGSEVICRIFEILEKKEVPSSLCKLFISFSFFAPEGKILDRSSQKTFILPQNAYLHCLCNVHHSDLIAQTFVFFLKHMLFLEQKVGKERNGIADLLSFDAHHCLRNTCPEINSKLSFREASNKNDS